MNLSMGSAFPRWRFRSIWLITTNALLGLAILALIYLAVLIVMDALRGDLDPLEEASSYRRLVFAALIYMAGHVMRILRLALLIGGWRIGFRVIGSFHFMTAAVGLAVPLKLGELYRVIELSNVVGSLTRAIAIVWWERAFDVSFVLLILFLAIAHSSGVIPQEFSAVIALAIVFIIMTALVFFVLPDNLRRLSVLIIRRYGDPATVPILRILDAVRCGILEAPRMVRGKVATVVTLSGLIWICEVACFAVIFPNVSLGSALDSLLSFLSALTRGETLLGALDKGEALTFGENTLGYLAATQIPLVFFGLISALSYASLRWRAVGSVYRYRRL